MDTAAPQPSGSSHSKDDGNGSQQTDKRRRLEGANGLRKRATAGAAKPEEASEESSVERDNEEEGEEEEEAEAEDEERAEAEEGRAHKKM